MKTSLPAVFASSFLLAMPVQAFDEQRVEVPKPSAQEIMEVTFDHPNRKATCHVVLVAPGNTIGARSALSSKRGKPMQSMQRYSEMAFAQKITQGLPIEERNKIFRKTETCEEAMIGAQAALVMRQQDKLQQGTNEAAPTAELKPLNKKKPVPKKPKKKQKDLGIEFLDWQDI